MKSTTAFSILLCLTSMPLNAAPFTLSKDSIFEMVSGLRPDTVTIRNTANVRLNFDSVAVQFEISQMPEFQLFFSAYPFHTIRNEEFRFGWGSRSFDNKLVLNPAESVKLTNFRFDLCINCPCMAKRLEVPVGDTISARILFYAQGFTDTLKIKGIRNVASMGLSFHSEMKRSQDRSVSGRYFNLSGRRIPTKPVAGNKQMRWTKLIAKK
jgi:hypothetical protein